jgi:hypothetical protein
VAALAAGVNPAIKTTAANAAVPINGRFTSITLSFPKRIDAGSCCPQPHCREANPAPSTQRAENFTLKSFTIERRSP